MDDSDMIIGWRNSTNGTTISERRSEGQDLPTMYPSQPSTVIPIPRAHPVEPWAKLSFSFRRALTVPAANFHAFTPTTKYIYAWGNTRPANPDNPGAGFSRHGPTDIGYIITGDFTGQVQAAGTGGDGNGTTTTPTVTDGGGAAAAGVPKPFVNLGSMSYETMVLAHGILLFIAWAVAPLAG